MTFSDFGLTYYEDKAFDELIREELTVKELIKRTNIPPGKVYSVLKSLSKRGIVSQNFGRPKRFCVKNPSKVISLLIEHKQEHDEEIIRKTRLLMDAIPKGADKQYFFRIGTASEDNKEMQLKIFNDAKSEVCQILNSRHKPKSNRQQKDEWEKAISDAVSRGVVFKSLYHKDSSIPKALLKLPKDKFKIRRTTQDMYRIDIADNKKVLIKIVYDDPLMFGGLIYLEDEKFARNLKKIFDDMWNNAE